MKKILTVLLLSSIITAQAQEFTISGTTKIATTGEKIYLELAGQPAKVVDSVLVDAKNGFKFKRKEADQGSIYQLNIARRQKVLFLAEGGETLVLQPDMSVKGSKTNDDYQALMKMYQGMVAENQKRQNEYAEAEKKKDQKKLAEIMAGYEKSGAAFSQKVKAMLPSMGVSMATLFATNFIDPQTDFKTLDTLARKFEKERPNMKQAQVFVGNVKRMRGVQIGDVAPEIAIPDTLGRELKLSSLKGKYVLIDFWASWCGPCRQENPNVVQVYKKYKDRGFTILSVSLDDNKASWLKAIAKDGLTWSHVSELKKWNSVVAQTYGVNGIPAAFLLDKDGKVIAKNLRGDALEAKLAEVMK
jgi:thiol-disulfide isomerase/thioredoxin